VGEKFVKMVPKIL